MGNPQSRRHALRGIFFGAAAFALPRFLSAEDSVVVTKLKALKEKSGRLKPRLDSMESILASIEDRAERCVKRQDDIDALIKEVSENSAVISLSLTEFVADVQKMRKTLDACKTDVERARCEIQQANCLLQQVNCILCKLPANIRRAKIRAFIFGFLVGMGVGAAIGGPGGGVGAVSAGVW